LGRIQGDGFLLQTRGCKGKDPVLLFWGHSVPDIFDGLRKGEMLAPSEGQKQEESYRQEKLSGIHYFSSSKQNAG
jgi:hypothetical protein